MSRYGDNNILPKYYMRYFRSVIKRVNKTEDEHKDQKIRSRTGLLKVSSLSNTRASHNDTILAWIMLHNISNMYRDLKHQEILQALLSIQTLSLPYIFLCNRRKQDEVKENVKRSNSINSSAHIIKQGRSYGNILSVLSNLDSTDSILKYILPLSSDILKEDFILMGGKISYLPDRNKQTVASEI